MFDFYYFSLLDGAAFKHVQLRVCMRDHEGAMCVKIALLTFLFGVLFQAKQIT